VAGGETAWNGLKRLERGDYTALIDALSRRPRVPRTLCLDRCDVGGDCRWVGGSVERVRYRSHQYLALDGICHQFRAAYASCRVAPLASWWLVLHDASGWVGGGAATQVWRTVPAGLVSKSLEVRLKQRLAQVTRSALFPNAAGAGPRVCRRVR
jgi:hypothetical protein